MAAIESVIGRLARRAFGHCPTMPRRVDRTSWTKPARPHNGPYRPYGCPLPPARGIRHIRRRHFARQESTGAMLFLATATAVGYMMWLVMKS